MATKAKFEQYIAEAKALRSAYSDAGVDFYLFLMRFEADEAAWKVGIDGAMGWATFADALQAGEIVRVSKYERFKTALRVCGGSERVRALGLDAAFEVVLIPDRARSKVCPDESARDVAIDELVAFRIRNGVEPSARSAATIVRKHFTPEPAPAPEENAFDRLKKENIALRRRVKALEKENTALRARLSVCERSGDRESVGTARSAAATA